LARPPTPPAPQQPTLPAINVNGSWLADQLARLEVCYPEVHLVFADPRRFAEYWTHRFLVTALTDTTGANSNG
jgi:hypothetical protein